MADNQEMKKAVEQIVNKIMAPEAVQQEQTAEKVEDTQTVEKAMPASNAANGGKDEIKTGSPLTEEQKLMADKKKEEAKKAKADEEEEDEEEKEEKKDKKKMKKSIEELADHLDNEELELIKAWREESDKEEVITKSEEAQSEKIEPAQEDLTKAFAKAVEDAIAPLKKAMEDKDTLIKGLSDKVEKMASQPAYDRRSISNLETIEKSTESSETLSKSQVAEKMLEMQIAGKGVNSHHIAEFESTGNISDPLVKAIVFKELKLN